MKHLRHASAPCVAALLGLLLMTTALAHDDHDHAEGPWSASLADVRRVAAMIPGARPLRINVAKVAESRRTKNFSVKGVAAEPSVQARTAYQVVYADGTLMIDAGMDLATHRFFGRGVDEPYYPGVAALVDAALLRAKLIVLTHEHGDHAAGVITSAQLAALAPKTILTRSQLRTLTTAPQIPSLRLTAEAARRFTVIDYERYFPLAPGIVLIKAPGHTHGSQMIYLALQSGAEYLFVGDVAWHMDGIRMLRDKDAPWVGEPEALMLAELRWLREVHQDQPDVRIVVSHDEDQRLDYLRRGVLGGALE